MHFELAVPEAGWTEAVFEADDHRYEITVSYLSDAPRDLLVTIAALLRGADESRVTFMQEPGEVVGVFRRLCGDRLRIKLFHGEDWGQADPERGTPVFAADVSLEKFAGQVTRAFAHLNRELGPEGYKARWMLYGFPQQELDAVDSLLRYE